MLRVAMSSFFDMSKVVIETIEEFDWEVPTKNKKKKLSSFSPNNWYSFSLNTLILLNFWWLFVSCLLLLLPHRRPRCPPPPPPIAEDRNCTTLRVPRSQRLSCRVEQRTALRLHSIKSILVPWGSANLCTNCCTTFCTRSEYVTWTS
jgi:hypothetical protein